MDKVVIFGGTGFIGLNLAAHLAEKGMEPIIIGRSKPKVNHSAKFVQWNAVKLDDWVQELKGAKALVNLCGRSVDCIKTPANCDLILRSRVQTTQLIGQALKQVSNAPKIWIQMSTAHIYGDPPSMMCSENSPTGYGLAPFVGKAWEKALLASMPEGMREVRLRTSFVIGKKGGAFPKLRLIAQLGLGGKIGNGSQGLSWIHEWDMSEIIYQAIMNPNYQGVVIASAPNPVSQKEFMRVLRKKIKMPLALPAPVFMLKLGAKFLFRTDPDLLLYGRYVRSKALVKLNYPFQYSDLGEAIGELVNKK